MICPFQRFRVLSLFCGRKSPAKLLRCYKKAHWVLFGSVSVDPLYLKIKGYGSSNKLALLSKGIDYVEVLHEE